LTTPEHLETLYASAAAAFPEMVHHDASGFEILPPGRPLARLIARAFDAYEMQASSHSSAI
ncbi:MAG: coproporphyrinogen III oxidase, partial [Alterinioella nitratireducens]